MAGPLWSPIEVAKPKVHLLRISPSDLGSENSRRVPQFAVSGLQSTMPFCASSMWIPSFTNSVYPKILLGKNSILLTVLSMLAWKAFPREVPPLPWRRTSFLGSYIVYHSWLLYLYNHHARLISNQLRVSGSWAPQPFDENMDDETIINRILYGSWKSKWMRGSGIVSLA